MASKQDLTRTTSHVALCGIVFTCGFYLGAVLYLALDEYVLHPPPPDLPFELDGREA